MTDAMPRQYPLYCKPERDRHGRIRVYFRKGKGKRTAINHALGTKEFDAAYAECLADTSRPTRTIKAAANTLAWLVARYCDSSAFASLSPATRRIRGNILKGVIEKAGNEPYVAITKSVIIKSREARSGSAHQARKFMDAMRGLFRWAIDCDLIQVDPTVGVKNPIRPKTEGHIAWSQDDVEQYRYYWPLGTHQRVWLEVLIGCGGRRGDSVTIGRQHIKDGIIAFNTQKEGIRAFVPLMPTMQEAVDIGPCGDLTFIIGTKGHAFVKEAFGNVFGAAARQAGLKRRTAHGVRKYSAICFAAMGLSDAELELIFGWAAGSGMAAYYRKQAQQLIMAGRLKERIMNAIAPNQYPAAPNLIASR